MIQSINNLHEYIEHTRLSPLITSEEVENLIKEAQQYNFVGVCVPPYWVKKAKRDIGERDTQLVTVIGFPLGYNRSEVKIQEIKSAIRDGADEYDVVVNLSAIKNGAYHWIKIETSQMAALLHENEKILKVIIETAYLNDEEIKQVCEVLVDSGVDYIKTSTGFAPKGAQIDQVKLIRSIIPEQVGIKASGGIRTLEQAKEFIQAGADRIGSSSGVQIMEALKVQN